ncbi:MAG: GspH/FimT family pseudopilin [Desulfobacterales bacterium]|jgi:prepilin-type N-terminal cleavage/methylation domain-containing protein
MMKNSGFTFIELMIVMAVIAILSSFTLVNFIGWLPKYKLGSAVRSMQCTLQLVRVAAINKNSTVTVLFSPGTDSCIAFLDNGDGGGTPGDGLQNGSEKLVRRIDLPAGIQLVNPTFGSTLQFNNRGLPSAGGDVVVETETISKTVRIFLSGKSQII